MYKFERECKIIVYSFFFFVRESPILLGYVWTTTIPQRWLSLGMLLIQ